MSLTFEIRTRCLEGIPLSTLRNALARRGLKRVKEVAWDHYDKRNGWAVYVVEGHN